MSVATYAVEEITEAKDGVVRYFSDEEGTNTNPVWWELLSINRMYPHLFQCLLTGNFYLSYVDPVVIGRGIFHSTNTLVCETVGSFKDSLCGILDAILDAIGDISKGKSFSFTHTVTFTFRDSFSVLFFSGSIDLSYIDPVVIGRRVFTVTNELVGGVVGSIQDVICNVINTLLDLVKGIYTEAAVIRHAEVQCEGFLEHWFCLHCRICWHQLHGSWSDGQKCPHCYQPHCDWNNGLLPGNSSHHVRHNREYDKRYQLYIWTLQ